MVEHAHNPSYMGGIGRRITVQASPGHETQDLIEKITKTIKGWKCGSSGRALA
jgi:hypothetical protein